jgi:hypothetical protein
MKACGRLALAWAPMAMAAWGLPAVQSHPTTQPTTLPTATAGTRHLSMNEIRDTILERAAALADFPGQQIPDATPEILHQADQIVGGTVFFYGRTSVKVGLKDIDWSGGHVKHQEWPAQLNRFFHLAPLAAAYRGTGDDRYAKAARAYIEDWIRGDPYATADTLRAGDNTLNMSIRLGSSQFAGWGGVLPIFLKSSAFDDAFVDQILASITRQANWLNRHLTPTGNWRISQLDALVFTALRFPFLPDADHWLKAGTSGMQAALATQFLPDGVHIERTPGYHHWMTQVAASYALLPRIFPQADAQVDPDLLARSLDYAAQSDLSGVNDSTASHRDPDKLEWVDRRREILARLGMLPAPPDAPPLAQVFADAGQVFVRTAWKPGADYLAFDASTWGGGHSHLSRLSFAFRSGGRMLVADPGIFSYEMSDPMASYGKSTPAHSTLNIDGLNQSGADARLLRAEFTDRTALIHARYDGGYWDGDYTWSFRDGRSKGVYGSHERIVFWIKGEYLLVLDSMSADRGREIHNVWQLGPMDGWSHQPEQRLWWSKNKDTNLLLQMIAPTGQVTMRVREGSSQPLAGWVGWHGNDAAPAPQVEFVYPATRAEDVWSVVLLVPFAGENQPAYKVRECRESDSGWLRYLELGLPDGSIDRFGWSRQLMVPVDDGRPFATDAPFVWYRTDAAGKQLGGYVLDGSHVTVDTRVALESGQRKARTFPSAGGAGNRTPARPPRG